jgi:hypothetical protein
MDLLYLENFLYLFINKMSPIYMLKLNKSSDLERPQLSFYSQGINAQCISFSNITHWSIMKVLVIRGKPVSFCLNKHFIALQRLMKLYSRFLFSLRSLRVLRLREETGKMPRWRAPPVGALYALAQAPPIGVLYVDG